MWKQLERLPRPDHTQAFLKRHFNGNEKLVAACFDRTSEFSQSYPYSCKLCGECTRRVVELPDGQLVAICSDDVPQCDDITIEKEETRVFVFSARKAAAYIAGQTAPANVFPDIKVIDGFNHLIRVGFYIPRGTIKFPVYFHMPFADGDYTSALNQLLLLEKSFVMLLPTKDGLSIEQSVALKNANSLILGLEEISDTAGQLVSSSTTDALRAFYDAQPDPNPEIQCVLFQTPSGAEWKDVTIKFVDGHTVRVTCKKITGVFNFTQMGMNDGRTGNPNKTWELLGSFAEERSNLTWDNSKATRLNKKRKQTLKDTLQKFFGMPDIDPFEDYKDAKGHVCYRSKCNIFPEDP